MESTFNETIEFEAYEAEVVDTQDSVARGVFFGLAFSIPLWAVIISGAVALLA